MKVISLAPFLLLGLALPVAAEAYKCRQADGRTVISSEPCATGSSTVKAIPDEPVSEENRRRAEQAAARDRDQAAENEAARQAREKRESEERLRAERLRLQAERSAPAQPTYVPVPYYVPGYSRPVRPYPHPQPLPEPMPPVKPGSKPDLYKVPSTTRGR